MLERVATRIAESLHVPRIAVLLQEGAFYRPAYAIGYAGVPQMELSDSSEVIQHLRKDPEPSLAYFATKTRGEFLAAPKRKAQPRPRSNRVTSASLRKDKLLEW